METILLLLLLLFVTLESVLLLLLFCFYKKLTSEAAEKHPSIENKSFPVKGRSIIPFLDLTQGDRLPTKENFKK